METVAVAILAALLGYLVRGKEFRRDRQFVVYSEFAGTFLRAAHAGAALFSIHTSLGQEMRRPEHQELTDRYWREWNEAAAGFEEAIAKLRLIGSDRMAREAAKLNNSLTKMSERFLLSGRRTREIPLRRGETPREMDPPPWSVKRCGSPQSSGRRRRET